MRFWVGMNLMSKQYDELSHANVYAHEGKIVYFLWELE